MKKILLFAGITLSAFQFSNAQWNNTSNNTTTGNVTIGENKSIVGTRTGGANSNMIGFEQNNNGSLPTLAISQYSTIPSEVRIYTPTDVGNGLSVYSDKLIAFFRRNGNVGLGTSSPAATLDIWDRGDSEYNGGYTSDYSFMIRNRFNSNFQLYAKSVSNNTYDESFRLGLKYNSEEDNGFISFYKGSNTSTGYLGFSTSGEERMLIDKDGNVGIGTTSSGAKLNVGTKTVNSPSTLVQFGESKPSGEARVLSLVNSGGGSNQATSLDFHNSGGWSPTGKIMLQQIGASTEAKMHFFTFNGSLKNRMTIDSDGNLGVATTDPNYKLDVQGGGLGSSFNFGSQDGLYDTGAFFSSYANSSAILNFMEYDEPFIFNFEQPAYSSKLELKFHKGMMGVGCVPDSPLTVNGKIHAKEVVIDVQGFADYVFENDYHLKSLMEVKSFIENNGHLEGFKSEAEIIREGLNIEEIIIKQQEKIEELTLYTIEQENKIKAQENKMNAQEEKEKLLEERLSKLEKLLLKE